MTVAFDRFDLNAYDVFLRAKRIPESELSYDWEADRYTLAAPSRFARILTPDSATAEADLGSLASHLFDFQAFVVREALDARRYAAWLDTGLGKTAVLLEWARQVRDLTGGRVLILSPLSIIPQTIAEAERFYGDELTVHRVDTREALAMWCMADGPAVGICNYEKFIPGVLPELRYLAGLVADESSLLKTGGGTIKWNVIKSSRGIEFKLSCTATPAPNDTMEYASQAAFLEKIRNEGEVLWTYFTKTKDGAWRVKPHARGAFYQFMSTWSIYMRNPARFGFADILTSLPEPELHEYDVPITDAQRELMYGLIGAKGGLFMDDRLSAVERGKLAQLARGFLYDGTGSQRTAARYDSRKPAKVAELVREDMLDGRQVLVWTVFDEESEIIAEELGGHGCIGSLHGSMSDRQRAEVIAAFKAGDLSVLITKAQLLGYGLNFQNCRSMVFSGIDDSFERMYQAIRRAYRYGQTEGVRVHVPYIRELEGLMFSNVRRKEAQFDEDTAIQEVNYLEALRERLAA